MSPKLMSRILLSSVFATAFFATGVMPTVAEVIRVSSGLTSDPLSISSEHVLTGGSVQSNDCGFISTQPHHVLQVAEKIDYMRLTIKATAGEPTLLIDGPDGRFCVLADSLSGESPEISGVWSPGTHEVYVGDLGGNQHPFLLELSQENN